MAYQKHILLGRITKTHGFGGAVTVKTEKVFSESIPGMESVFLEIDGKPVPFFIENIEHEGFGSLRIKFDGYNVPDKVREFVNCELFLTINPITENIINDLQTLHEYQVISDQNQNIGIIKEIIHNPGQTLLGVRTESGMEVLIPLHEDLIQEINHTEKIIIMILPNGLTDINRI